MVSDNQGGPVQSSSGTREWGTLGLLSISVSQSHADFAAFTHALTSRWTYMYLVRTTPDIEKLLRKPSEKSLYKTSLHKMPSTTSRGSYWHYQQDKVNLAF